MQQESQQQAKKDRGEECKLMIMDANNAGEVGKQEELDKHRRLLGPQGAGCRSDIARKTQLGEM